MKRFFRSTLGPLLLILLCPPAAMILWYTATTLEGSLPALWHYFQQEGLFHGIWHIWSPWFFGSPIAWKILALFAAVQLLFMRLVPGKPFEGPITPQGNLPRYKANGFASYLLTLGLFGLGWRLGFFSPTIIYDNLGALFGALNLFSLLFCLLLYFKGRYRPSTTDNSVTGNFVFDYYWGTELYPRLFGWDVKQFTNCRMGMMGWSLLLLSYAAKQKELYGLSDSMVVSVALQLLYITKFFLWEPGYLRSIDIMHDRAGFYICWGCLVWVPVVYTSPALYLVHHPNHLGPLLTALLLIGGASAILVNYWADRQRFVFRKREGSCTIWGRAPKMTHISYLTAQGEEKESLLLASGWWGVARHFHYLPEILGALLWSLPALFVSPLPYFYVVFLTILLFDRAYRDEERCLKKYGPGWHAHCEKVPYKVLPLIW